MPTSYVKRTTVSSSYNVSRLGGAYLVDKDGNYILTSLGQRIILKVPGGKLRLNDWSTRPVI